MTPPWSLLEAILKQIQGGNKEVHAPEQRKLLQLQAAAAAAAAAKPAAHTYIFWQKQLIISLSFFQAVVNSPEILIRRALSLFHDLEHHSTNAKHLSHFPMKIYLYYCRLNKALDSKALFRGDLLRFVD